MADKYSKTLITEWSDYEQIGIWDHCTWSVRLYSDRAIYKGHTVRWANNSGSLVDVHERWTGPVIDRLKEIADLEQADNADYTKDVRLITVDYRRVRDVD